VKRITVTLTEAQVFSTKQALEWSQSEGIDRWSEGKQDFVIFKTPEEKKHDAFLQRIIDKISKAEVS